MKIKYTKPAAPAKPAEKQGAQKVGNGRGPLKPVTVTVDHLSTVQDNIAKIKNACKATGRELSDAEQKRIDSCKTTWELSACLNSMGIKTRVGTN